MKAKIKQKFLDAGVSVEIGHDTPNEVWIGIDTLFDLDKSLGVFRVFCDGQWVDADPRQWDIVDPVYPLQQSEIICQCCGSDSISLDKKIKKQNANGVYKFSGSCNACKNDLIATFVLTQIEEGSL